MRLVGPEASPVLSPLTLGYMLIIEQRSQKGTFTKHKNAFFKPNLHNDYYYFFFLALPSSNNT